MSTQSSSRQTTTGNPTSDTNTVNVVPRRPRTPAECGPLRFSISPGRDTTVRWPTAKTSFILFDGDEWECTIHSDESKARIECKRLNPPDGRSELFEGSIIAPPPSVPGSVDRAAEGLPMEGIVVSAIPAHRFHQSSRTKAKYTQNSYDGHAQVWVPLAPPGTRFTLKCLPPGPKPNHDGYQCLLPSKGHRTDQSSLHISTGDPARHIFHPYDSSVVLFSDPPGGPLVFPESDDDEDDEHERDGDDWTTYLQKTGFGTA